jgi:hypothetical protein
MAGPALSVYNLPMIRSRATRALGGAEERIAFFPGSVRLPKFFDVEEDFFEMYV